MISEMLDGDISVKVSVEDSSDKLWKHVFVKVTKFQRDDHGIPSDGQDNDFNVSFNKGVLTNEDIENLVRVCVGKAIGIMK